MTCSVDGCDRPPEKVGLCGAHYRRTLRGSPLGEPMRAYGDQWETLMAAVRAYMAADDDEAFRRKGRQKSRIEERIHKAAIRYAAAIKRRRTMSPEG